MKVLFVCMGNICRSPTAEGVLRAMLQQHAPTMAVEIDSAGTHGFHIGHAPDKRAVAAARRRGIDLSALQARQVSVQDFAYFDLILAMDRNNQQTLLAMAPAQYHSRIKLFMHYAAESAWQEVPDPYYGDLNGFEQVLDLLEQATKGLLQEWGVVC